MHPKWSTWLGRNKSKVRSLWLKITARTWMAYGLVSLVDDMFKNSGVCLRWCRMFQKSIFFSVSIFEKTYVCEYFWAILARVTHSKRISQQHRFEKKGPGWFSGESLIAEADRISGVFFWRIDGVCTTGVYKHIVYGRAMSSFFVTLWVSMSLWVMYR